MPAHVISVLTKQVYGWLRLCVYCDITGFGMVYGWILPISVYIASNVPYIDYLGYCSRFMCCACSVNVDYRYFGVKGILLWKVEGVLRGFRLPICGRRGCFLRFTHCFVDMFQPCCWVYVYPTVSHKWRIFVCWYWATTVGIVGLCGIIHFKLNFCYTVH